MEVIIAACILLIMYFAALWQSIHKILNARYSGRDLTVKNRYYKFLKRHIIKYL